MDPDIADYSGDANIRGGDSGDPDVRTLREGFLWGFLL